MKSFASDNNSGVHPRIFEAMLKANQGSAPAYGNDAWTEEAVATLQATFGPDARPWFVFLGTAANVLGLKTMIRSHQAVICADSAHIHCDECGSPEAITGSKLLPVPQVDGKVRLEAVEPLLHMRESVHHVYPKVLSITQSTELGAVYSLEDLRTIKAFCTRHGLFLHMDGARLSNAAAALGLSLRALSTDAGVDVLSFGGTKNGLMSGEAVVFLNPELGRDFPYYRKQHMQLGSKMRFVTAQFTEYLKDGLWRENALAANRAAKRLEARLRDMPHVRIAHPVDVNAVFARMHKDVIAALQSEFYFYTVDPFDAQGFPKDWRMVRLMASFNTTDTQIDEFTDAINACAPLSRG